MRKNRKPLLYIASLFIAFFVICVSSQSQTTIFSVNDSTVHEYYKSLYEYRFSQVPNFLAQLNSTSSETSYLLFQVNYLWWMIITGEQDKPKFEQCFQLLDQADVYSRKLLEANETNDFKTTNCNQLVIQLFKARISVFNNQYGKALLGYSKLLHHLNKLMVASDTLDDEVVDLIAGLYHYSVGKIKKKYFMFWPYFAVLPKADFEKGNQMMWEALRSNNLLIFTEANYFLMKISLEIDDDYEKALFYNQNLIARYPDNILFRYYEFKIFNLKKDFEKVKEIAEVIQNLSETTPGLSTKQRNHFVELLNNEAPKFQKP